MKRIKLMKALAGMGTLSVLGIGTAITVASCSRSPEPPALGLTLTISHSELQKNKKLRDACNLAIDENGNLTRISQWNIQTNKKFDDYINSLSVKPNGIRFENITSVVAQAFYECTQLSNDNKQIKQIEFANTNNSTLDLEINDEAFDGCLNINQVNFSASNKGKINVKFLGAPFYLCSNLTEINLPPDINVVELNDSAFMSSGLKSIDLSYSSLAMIGSNAFQDCRSLMEIKLPESLFGQDVRPEFQFNFKAFYNCSNLKNIFFPKVPLNATTFGTNVFNGCSEEGTFHILDSTSQADALQSFRAISPFDNESNWITTVYN